MARRARATPPASAGGPAIGPAPRATFAIVVAALATIDLNLVHTFAKVVELGSFTRAAAVLELPKSSVSRAVTRLEEALGVRLLQRTTRNLRLTAAGERYLSEVQGPLTNIEEASAEVTELGSEPRGLVRISVPHDLAEEIAAHILPDFLRRHPRIQVELSASNRRVNLVEEGFDLALRAGTLDDSSLVAKRISASDMTLFAAPAYLARRGEPKRLADLAEHDCIQHRGARGFFPWRLTGPKGIEHVTVSGPVIGDDMGVVRQLVLAGLGIGLLPEFTAAPEVMAGGLRRVLSGYALKSATIYLVSPPLKHAPARVTLLREHLARELTKRFSTCSEQLRQAGANQTRKA